MRSGETVDAADAAVAVRIADRELERLARIGRPLAIRLWRGWSLFVMVVVTVGAVTRFTEGRWLHGLWLLFVGVMIGPRWPAAAGGCTGSGRRWRGRGRRTRLCSPGTAVARRQPG